MFVMTSTCPRCGAPIYAPTETDDGDLLLMETGFWRTVPPPTFSCDCREMMSAAPPAAEPVTLGPMPYRAPRRQSGSGAESIRPFFSPGPREN